MTAHAIPTPPADRGFLTLEDASLAGKTALVRLDLNMPVRDGVITERARLDRSLPTLRTLIDRAGKTVILSHFDRPKGQRDPAMSLAPIVPALSEELGRTVHFAEDCVGPLARDAVAALPRGGVLLLENTRFHPGEEANDPVFIGALAGLGDLYVNDAFSCAHRAHASTAGLADVLPAYAGLAVQAELEALEAAVGSPERPLVAVVAGAKVSTKLPILENLVGRVDCLVIGGGMANTFLAAQGHDVGKSLCERAFVDTARRILEAAGRGGCEILLPTDAVVAKAFQAHAEHTVCPVTQIDPDGMILDLGPKTVAAIADRVDRAKTVVWNGPLGAFELAPFDAATVAAARHVAARSRAGHVRSVAGGGDTMAALVHAGAAQGFSYVSCAGGAFLEWLEGRDLPGVASLRRAAERA